MGTPRRRLPRAEPPLLLEDGQVALRRESTKERFVLGIEELARVDLADLAPVRRIPRHRDKRSIPRFAYVQTLKRHVEVESGLEADLVRDLDRSHRVDCVVAQGLMVSLAGIGLRHHVFDVLARDCDGPFTVWMVRSPKGMTPQYQRLVSYLTETLGSHGCPVRLFTGHSAQRAANLMLVDAHRRPPSQAGELLPFVVERARRGLSVSEVVRHPRFDARRLLPVFWHAVWLGLVGLDLDRPITGQTRCWATPVLGAASMDAAGRWAAGVVDRAYA